jgi:hydroxymethylbilane synthase
LSHRIRIATRESPLALWQANHVAGRLRALDPTLEVALVKLSTEGDRFLSAPLAVVGGKGLFVKEIEQALIDRRAEVAVHSLKDMTSLLPPGLLLGAIPEREDPRDAWVSPTGQGFEALPRGARVGTSSLRRTCQLLERRPDLEIVSIRGNVQTRLRRTAEQGLAGCVLALAGLRRLGLEDQVTEVLAPERSLPAVGQGALAVQCREDDAPVRALLARLEHAPSRTAVAAERAFLARLEGGCSVPLAGYATVEGDRVRLRALIGSPDGKRLVRGEREGTGVQAEALGLELAQALLDQGGREILAAFAGSALGQGARG